MTKLRPTIERGWLGLLYNKCVAYTKDPISEIERLAQQALLDGNIDDRRYTVLKHRIPFSGVECKSQKEVGRMIGVSGQMVRSLEQGIYVTFDRKYLPRKE